MTDYGSMFDSDTVEALTLILGISEDTELNRVANSKVHDFVWFPTSYIDTDHGYLVVESDDLASAEKLIYYVGGENSKELVLFSSTLGVSVWSGIEDRFDDRFVD